MSTTIRRVAATALCLTTLVLATACAPPSGTTSTGTGFDTARARADAEMTVALAAFVEHRGQRPAPFDWSSDGCSKSPDRPFGFDFTAACWRHDFGYRNFLHGLRLDPTRTRKAAIDARLAADLDAICERHTLWVGLCGQVGRAYVWAVRVAGR